MISLNLNTKHGFKKIRLNINEYLLKPIKSGTPEKYH